MVIKMPILEHGVARWASVLLWLHVDLPHVPSHLLHSFYCLRAKKAKKSVVASFDICGH